MACQMPLIACHECDLLQREIFFPPGKVVSCARCGAELYRSAHKSLDKPLAFLLTATVALIVANMYPIVGLEIQGSSNSLVSEPVKSTGYEPLVAAQSRALAVVSRDLAQALRTVAVPAD